MVLSDTERGVGENPLTHNEIFFYLESSERKQRSRHSTHISGVTDTIGRTEATTMPLHRWWHLRVTQFFSRTDCRMAIGWLKFIGYIRLYVD
jgi:hypothetical protein